MDSLGTTMHVGHVYSEPFHHYDIRVVWTDPRLKPHTYSGYKSRELAEGHFKGLSESVAVKRLTLVAMDELDSPRRILAEWERKEEPSEPARG